MQQNTREVIPYIRYPELSLSITAPESFGEHWHWSAEFILAQEPDSVYTINSTEYVLDAGDVLLIWPTELHSIVHSVPGRSIIVQIEPELITSLNDICVHFHKIEKIHVLTKNNDEIRQLAVDYITEMFRIYTAEDVFAETRIKILISQLMLKIAETAIKNTTEINDNNHPVSGTFLKIRNACTYITAHCEEDITQVDIARQTGFSPYYFSRIFKKYTGQSFNDFLNNQRIRRALQLLRTESMPITEIVFSSGFQSISNFNKVFKKYLNCSPNEYRKLHIRAGVPENEENVL